MALPLPSSPHWAPTRTIAGTNKDYQFGDLAWLVVLADCALWRPISLNKQGVSLGLERAVGQFKIQTGDICRINR